MNKRRIAVTMGDPKGIGPEIVLKALSWHPEIQEMCEPIIFGDPKILQRQAEICGIDTDFATLNPSEGSATYIQNKLNIVAVSQEKPEDIKSPAGKLAFNYINAAINAVDSGQVSAISTAPINKEALRDAGISYLDHTEIFEKLTQSENTMTLFMVKTLRIFFYSRHIAFREIVPALNREKLVSTLLRCKQHLIKIGIDEPKLALAALNPHGGEHGMFGPEEEQILLPAVTDARHLGVDVEGPVPADSVFHMGLEAVYDGILSLYHDQGHIAAKTYDFYKTVSLTMGLPFLRTSVDHGTAYDLANQNLADETSMVEAIIAAARYAW